MDKPTTYGWDVRSLNLGRDISGPLLFFVDNNSNQHEVHLNEKQILLLLSQIPDVIETAPV